MSRRPNIFQQIQVTKPKRNKFDLSHEKKMSLQMGKLIPIFWKETMPGDQFRVTSEIFLRMAPMLAPIMHRVDVTTHYFKVPVRLLWNEWEDFITGGREGTSAPEVPYMQTDVMMTANANNVATGSLADYLGLPVQNWIDGAGYLNTMGISSLPFRAYQRIYDEWYRDQNVQEPLELSQAGGQADATETNILCTLRNRAWEKDYFTSALPWPQRGPEMLMPLSGNSTVTYKDVSLVRLENGGIPGAGELSTQVTGTAGTLRLNGGTASPGRIENIDTVSITSSGTSINDLRTALRIQEWLEKNARGGARYIEQILHHFGVVSSDARLQRSEYLGGGKQAMKISEVLSTVEATEPQGNMAGHGISAGRTNGFTTYCEEHCIIMGIMSIIPRTAYQDGIHREWTRFNKFEYPWPELAHLGEQEVKQWEVYWADNIVPDTDAWGYQSRYSEFKYAADSVHGDFRTNLDNWHMGRKFAAPPSLNESFIAADPTQRIFAVTDEEIHKIYAQIYHHVDALRPLPYFGTPRL